MPFKLEARNKINLQGKVLKVFEVSRGRLVLIISKKTENSDKFGSDSIFQVFQINLIENFIEMSYKLDLDMILQTNNLKMNDLSFTFMRYDQNYMFEMNFLISFNSKLFICQLYDDHFILDTKIIYKGLSGNDRVLYWSENHLTLFKDDKILIYQQRDSENCFLENNVICLERGVLDVQLDNLTSRMIVLHKSEGPSSKSDIDDILGFELQIYSISLMIDKVEYFLHSSILIDSLEIKDIRISNFNNGYLILDGLSYSNDLKIVIYGELKNDKIVMSRADIELASLIQNPDKISDGRPLLDSLKTGQMGEEINKNDKQITFFYMSNSIYFSAWKREIFKLETQGLFKLSPEYHQILEERLQNREEREFKEFVSLDSTKKKVEFIFLNRRNKPFLLTCLSKLLETSPLYFIIDAFQKVRITQ